MPKETLDIWAVPDCDAPEGFNLRLNPTDRRYYMGEDAVRLGSTEVFFDTPADMTREQMALKAVETLQERQEQVMAEAKLKHVRLQRKIDALLLLPAPAPTAPEGDLNDVPF